VVRKGFEKAGAVLGLFELSGHHPDHGEGARRSGGSVSHILPCFPNSCYSRSLALSDKFVAVLLAVAYENRQVSVR